MIYAAIELSDRKVLCVVVSTSGFADHKVIETPTRHSRERLIRISNFLTDNYAGRTLREVRDSLLNGLSRYKGDVEQSDDLTLVVLKTDSGLGRR